MKTLIVLLLILFTSELKAGVTNVTVYGYKADLNQDGVVDIQDFSIFSREYGKRFHHHNKIKMGMYRCYAAFVPGNDYVYMNFGIMVVIDGAIWIESAPHNPYFDKIIDMNIAYRGDKVRINGVWDYFHKEDANSLTLIFPLEGRYVFTYWVRIRMGGYE